MLPIPKKLLEAGVRDMVRISDARMSGTSYGTCVLHVCPESHVGGPLGLVEGRRPHRLDAAARRLDLLVDDAEMAARRARLDGAARALRARLRRDVLGARAASRRRMRLRLPRPAGRQPGAGDPLNAAVLAAADQRRNQLPDAIALTIVTP